MDLPNTHVPLVLLVGADAAARETLQVAAETLESFGLRWETRREDEPASTIASIGGAFAVIVASPAETLPARWSAATRLPTIRVPVEGSGRAGPGLLRDDGTSRLPAAPIEGVFATMAIGVAGARNAALFVVAALATTDENLRASLAAFRQRQTDAVLAEPPPGSSHP